MAKNVNAALKAWTFEAKAIGPEAKAKTKKLASRPRPGLEDYITDYKDILARLGITALETRRLRGDLIT